MKKNSSVIYNTAVKSKSEVRAESEKALNAFLRKGGVIQVDTRKRRDPKSKMSAKSSRGFVSGTGGFANGYPRKSVAI